MDVSNVCRDAGLGGPGVARWDRLEILLEAWNGWAEVEPQPVVWLVADESLRPNLSSDDKQRLRAALADYGESWPHADKRILELAEKHDARVLSRDRFRGHYHLQPWIESSDRQFVTWTVDRRRPVLRWANMRDITSFSKSQGEEREELGDRGIRSAQARELLRMVYWCNTPDCMRRRFAIQSGVSDTPPSYDGEGAICEICELPLTAVGPREKTVIIKMSPHPGRRGGRSGNEVTRVPIVAGTTLKIGRSHGDISLRPILATEERRHVSREHLALTYTGTQVDVVDLDSSNGTDHERWDHQARDWRPAVRLAAHAPMVLNRRDRVVVAGVLAISISGREYPFDMPASAAAEDSSNDATTSQ